MTIDRRHFQRLTVSGALGVALTACGRRDDSPLGERYGGVLSANNVQETGLSALRRLVVAASLAPSPRIEDLDNPAQAPWVGAAFETLTNLTPYNQVQPGMAQSWDVLNEGLVYRLRLRKARFFSNGSPCSAIDVALSLNRGAERRRGWSLQIVTDFWQHARALDDNTIEITLHKPCNTLLHDIAHVSASIYKPDTTKSPHAVAFVDETMRLGTGVFDLRIVQMGHRIVLRRVEFGQQTSQQNPQLLQEIVLLDINSHDFLATLYARKADAAMVDSDELWVTNENKLLLHSQTVPSTKTVVCVMGFGSEVLTSRLSLQRELRHIVDQSPFPQDLLPPLGRRGYNTLADPHHDDVDAGFFEKITKDGGVYDTPYPFTPIQQKHRFPMWLTLSPQHSAQEKRVADWMLKSWREQGLYVEILIAKTPEEHARSPLSIVTMPHTPLVLPRLYRNFHNFHNFRDFQRTHAGADHVGTDATGAGAGHNDAWRSYTPFVNNLSKALSTTSATERRQAITECLMIVREASIVIQPSNYNVLTLLRPHIKGWETNPNGMRTWQNLENLA